MSVFQITLLLQVIADNALDLMRFAPQHLPWAGRKVESLQSIIAHDSSSFLGPSGANHTVSLFNSSRVAGTIGLFFGAQWSQPSQKFLPLLRAAYKPIKEQQNSTNSTLSEIVFVSLDQSESEFEDYRKDIPFPALPFNDRRRALLQIGMNVKSIPSLGNSNITS